ncbi:MAG TPA: agmatine deiminase family protein [Ignavibacteriaceae bacterium]|nr:agmatine deiminase family protein [Ignavibacteriaceae bacterium]
MKNDNQIDTQDKFFLKAEWEEHKSTWIGWPHQKTDWPGKFEPIPWVFGEIVRKLSFNENVNVLVQSDKLLESALYVLKKNGANLKNVVFDQFKTDRGWTRDSGPAFVKRNGKTELIKFGFNAWAKYKNYKKDRLLPDYISKHYNLPMTPAVYNDKLVVLEGGSIDTNGKGTLVTTTECLLDEKVQTRNKGFKKDDYEKVFNEYFGVTNVLWLNKGIAGDDTHGHVDDLCRFVNEKTVVLVQEENPKDANYKNLKENKEILSDLLLQDGSKLEVIDLPMPEPLFFDGERLPASYANFYIANNIVLVPTFNDPNDYKALGILSEIFKDKKINGIHAVDLVWGLGTIHCLTHEQIK